MEAIKGYLVASHFSYLFFHCYFSSSNWKLAFFFCFLFCWNLLLLLVLVILSISSLVCLTLELPCREFLLLCSIRRGNFSKRNDIFTLCLNFFHFEVLKLPLPFLDGFKFLSDDKSSSISFIIEPFEVHDEVFYIFL